MEIVGEAVARVSPGNRERHLEIPWTAIVGMRNRLIHGYNAVDFHILVAALTRDLPHLVAALNAILDPEIPR